MTTEAERTDATSQPAAGRPEAEIDAKPPWRKVLLLAVVVAGLLAVAYLSPLRDYLGRLREVSDYIRSLGVLAPLAMTLSVAVLVGMGFPRLLFCVLAGMTFGFWWGLLWAQTGTLLGNYALFLGARFTGSEWARRYLSRRGQHLIQREGILGVILARQLPVPGLAVNLACGLFSVRHRDFLLGTAIGQLPEAIPCTLIGAGALKESFGKSAGLISLAVVFAVVVWVGLRYLLRRKSAAPPVGSL